MIKRFKQQESRGTDGFGYFVPFVNRLVHNTKQHKILRQLKRDNPTEVLFHHRYPTATGNTRNSCHPFSTKDYFKTNYVFVHNGTLDNKLALYTQHKKLGIEYVSYEPDTGKFNDSEALMWDFALTIEGKQPEMKATGDIAFVCIAQTPKGRKAKKIYWGRNYARPLVVDTTSNILTIASESLSSNAVTCAVDTLYWYDYQEESFGEKPFKIPVTAWSSCFGKNDAKYGAQKANKYIGSSYTYVDDYDDEQYEYDFVDIDDDDDDEYDYKKYRDSRFTTSLPELNISDDGSEAYKTLQGYLDDVDGDYEYMLEWLETDLIADYKEFMEMTHDKATSKEGNLLLDRLIVGEQAYEMLGYDFNQLTKGVS